MDTALEAESLSFRYRILDVRELDGERLLRSEWLGDNVIAILARLQDRMEAVTRVVGRISALEPGEREAALSQLLIVAGLRHLEEFVEQEARKSAHSK